MARYEEEWTDDQRGIYDECYRLGQEWAEDPDTDWDDIQQVINLAEADDDVFDDAEIDFPPLVDAVAEATGENVTSVPASQHDPGFRGFTDAVRSVSSGNVFGL